jgi:2-keto-4-pentenoate hydratase
VRDLLGDDLEAAYRVQEAATRRRLSHGERVVGRKVGLTSEAVQRQLGVDRPDFGVLFAADDDSADGVVPFGDLIAPRIEAEIAFILGSDILDAGREAVTAAIAWVAPALEIVDSRIENWDITIVDTVADNASSARFVLGDARLPISDLDPVAVTMSMTLNGEVVSSGNGAACLGDPINALVWVAETALALGAPLRAGDIVLSGALGPMVSFAPGDRVHAEIVGLGSVSAQGGAGR